MGKQRMRQIAARAAIVSAGGAACIAAGAWVGNDAAAQVDARYLTEPVVADREPVVQEVPPAEPVEVAAPAAAPPADSIWGRDVGPDERAFFDERPEPVRASLRVRVHRGEVAAPEVIEVEDNLVELPADGNAPDDGRPAG